MLWRNRELNNEAIQTFALYRAEASLVNPLFELEDILDSLGQLICPQGIATVYMGVGHILGCMHA